MNRYEKLNHIKHPMHKEKLIIHYWYSLNISVYQLEELKNTFYVWNYIYRTVLLGLLRYYRFLQTNTKPIPYNKFGFNPEIKILRQTDERFRKCSIELERHSAVCAMYRFKQFKMYSELYGIIKPLSSSDKITKERKKYIFDQLNLFDKNKIIIPNTQIKIFHKNDQYLIKIPGISGRIPIVTDDPIHIDQISNLEVHRIGSKYRIKVMYKDLL